MKDTIDTYREKLPLAVREAAAWRTSSYQYKRAYQHDSAAYASEQQVSSRLYSAWNGERALRTSAEAERDQFKHKAHKRGLLNWILIIGGAVVTAAFLTH